MTVVFQYGRVLGVIFWLESAKQWLCKKGKFLGLFSCKRDTPVAATFWVRFGDRLGKPMGLFLEPFLIGQKSCRTKVPRIFRIFVPNFVTKLGKRKHTPPCSSAELFFAEKKWGPQRKDFGGGYGFPGFYRVFVSTTGPESFSLLRPEKFPKRSSFGGGCVRFFLPCEICPEFSPIFWGP